MRHYHHADNGARTRQYPHIVGSARRADTASQFVAAGFEMTDWNKFKLVVKNRTYKVAPGRNEEGRLGHKVTGRTINGNGLWFPAKIEPAKIAKYLTSLADNPIEIE